MVLIPPKPLSTASLAALLAMLSSIPLYPLYRELLRGGLSAVLRRMGKASYVILNPRIPMRLYRLLSVAETQPVLNAAPHLPFKYLGDYLGSNLSRDERAAILFHHYAFLKQRVCRGFFSVIADGRILLWETCAANSFYRIWLTFPRSTHCEGDLELILQADSVDIYFLSFSIGPGNIVDSSADHTIFVSRIQGKGNGFTLIRQATKAMHEVAPPMLLITALEGIASALSIKNLVGISGLDQVASAHESRPNAMYSAYDELWRSMGGELLTSRLYRLSLPLPDKPIESIQRRHRSRVLRKREFKIVVKTAVSSAFGDAALQVSQQ